MKRENVSLLKHARGMCLLYGIACFVAGIISFAMLDEMGLGAVLLLVAIFGFWRISHKMRSVLNSEEPKYFKEVDRDKDAYGRRE